LDCKFIIWAGQQHWENSTKNKSEFRKKHNRFLTKDSETSRIESNWLAWTLYPSHFLKTFLKINPEQWSVRE